MSWIFPAAALNFANIIKQNHHRDECILAEKSLGYSTEELIPNLTFKALSSPRFFRSLLKGATCTSVGGEPCSH